MIPRFFFVATEVLLVVFIIIIVGVLVVWLFGCLVAWLFGCLVVWLFVRLFGCVCFCDRGCSGRSRRRCLSRFYGHFLGVFPWWLGCRVGNSRACSFRDESFDVLVAALSTQG